MKTIGFAALGAGLLVACGGDSGDRAHPRLLEPDARGVPVAVPLVVSLPAGADLSSFAPGAVTLRAEVNDGRQTVPVAVSLDRKARTVELTPGRALERMTFHEVRVTGLRDGGGQALPVFTLRFLTRVNGIRDELRYRQAPPPGKPSGQAWLYAWQRDAEGWPTAVNRYYGAGPDGVWHTPDDVLVSWQGYDGNGLTGPMTVTTYSAPGADGAWHTADDVASGWTRYVYDAQLHLSRTSARTAGPDGVLSTSDDVRSCATYLEDGEGRRVTYALCVAGPDGVLDTDDDGSAPYLRYAYDGEGRLDHYDQLAAGDDLVLGTADDYVAYRTRYLYEARRTVFTSGSTGADRLAGTADDQVSLAKVYETDPLGATTRETQLLDPGLDATWATGDDEVDWSARYAYDASGSRTTVKVDNAGNDGVLGTADDFLSQDVVYDADR